MCLNVDSGKRPTAAELLETTILSGMKTWKLVLWPWAMGVFTTILFSLMLVMMWTCRKEPFISLLIETLRQEKKLPLITMEIHKTLLLFGLIVYNIF